MRTVSSAIAILACVLIVGAAAADSPAPADEVIALERAALDRWGRGDPGGFLDTYADEVSYFDVATEQRIDGHAAMRDYYRPFTGKIRVARYEMISPRVQRRGDVAVLSYNLRSDAVQPDGTEVTMRWNSTAVYARSGGTWKMIHSHWSLTAPPCLRGTV